MKHLLLSILALIIISSCSKEKQEAIQPTPTYLEGTWRSSFEVAYKLEGTQLSMHIDSRNPFIGDWNVWVFEAGRLSRDERTRKFDERIKFTSDSTFSTASGEFVITNSNQIDTIWVKAKHFDPAFIQREILLAKYTDESPF